MPNPTPNIEKGITEAIYCGMSVSGKRRVVRVFGKELYYKPNKVFTSLPLGCHFTCKAERKDGISTIWFGTVEPIMEDGKHKITQNDDWTINNIAGKRAKAMTASLNKIKKKESEDIFDLTINEIAQKMSHLSRKQRTNVTSYILDRLASHW